MTRVAVITISDSRSAGTKSDQSGPAAAELLAAAGLSVSHAEIIPDARDEIAARLRALLPQFDLIITTGGTGIADRDVTPEAIRPLLDKELPGFGEIMRSTTFARTPLSIISRNGAGVAGRTLIIWLPGSPRGVRECLEPVLPATKHLLKVLTAGGVDCAAQGEPRPA